MIIGALVALNLALTGFLFLKVRIFNLTSIRQAEETLKAVRGFVSWPVISVSENEVVSIREALA